VDVGRNVSGGVFIYRHEQQEITMSIITMSKKLRTADEVAEILGVSVFSIRRWARLKMVPAGRSLGGGRWLFTDQQIDTIRECLAGNTYAEVD
jgi:transposase